MFTPIGIYPAYLYIVGAGGVIYPCTTTLAVYLLFVDGLEVSHHALLIVCVLAVGADTVITRIGGELTPGLEQ